MVTAAKAHCEAWPSSTGFGSSASMKAIRKALASPPDAAEPRATKPLDERATLFLQSLTSIREAAQRSGKNEGTCIEAFQAMNLYDNGVKYLSEAGFKVAEAGIAEGAKP